MRHHGSLLRVAVLVLASCAPTPARRVAAPTTTAVAGFVDRVWRVADSTSVAEGTLYVFLSEGTLVITSPDSTPMLGTWSQSAAQGSAFVMVEQSISYPVDILALTADSFVIRSHNPGDPVDITLVPAGGD